MYPNGRIRILPDYLFGPRLFILGDGCQAGGEGEETRTLRNNDPCCCTYSPSNFWQEDGGVSSWPARRRH